MAWANVQRVDDRPTSAGTSHTTTISAAGAGNLLVAVCAIDKSSGGFTAYPSGFTPIYEYDSANVSWHISYRIAAGGETSLSWTWTTSRTSTQWVGEYSGLSATPLDQTQTANSGTTAVTSQTTGTTATTTQANELAIVLCADDTWGNMSSGRAWTNSFTEVSFYEATGSSRPGISVAEKSLSSTGTVESTFSTTDPSGDQMVAAVLTFKEAGGAVVTPLFVHQMKQQGMS